MSSCPHLIRMFARREAAGLPEADGPEQPHCPLPQLPQEVEGERFGGLTRLAGWHRIREVVPLMVRNAALGLTRLQRSRGRTEVRRRLIAVPRWHKRQ